MVKNVGKRFEEDFKSSMPEYVLCHRLPDPAQSFEKTAKFSHKNPCDFHLFDTKNRTFYALELKTTNKNSISFESPFDTESKTTRMIHKHQIIGLANYSKYQHVKSGFIFNFRNEKHKVEEMYFQNIKDFLRMIKDIDKKSFNKSDLLKYNPINITGNKKITRYAWDIEFFLIDSEKQE